jgi:hypothetical protein
MNINPNNKNELIKFYEFLAYLSDKRCSPYIRIVNSNTGEVMLDRHDKVYETKKDFVVCSDDTRISPIHYLKDI